MFVVWAIFGVLGGSHQVLTTQPTWEIWIWATLLIALILSLKTKTGYFRVIVLFFALGTLSGHWQLSSYLASRLTPTYARADIHVAGIVRGIVSLKPYGQRFDLEIESWQAVDPDLENLPAPQKRQPPKLRVHWYQLNTKLKTGDRIEAILRVKPPTPLHSGAGQAEERKAIEYSNYGSGYIRRLIRRQTEPTLDPQSIIDRTRAKTSTRIQRLAGEPSAKSIVTALSNGDRGKLSGQTWQLLNQTGTSHLMAISGMHIGLFATAVWRFLSFILAMITLPVFMARHIANTALTILATTAYALFCGFGLPAQRALLMVAVYLLTQAFYQNHSPYKSLGIAFIVIVLCQPFAIYSAGLWLSFCVVGTLFILRQKYSYQPWWQQGLAIQLGINALSMPICFYWFTMASFSASVANFIAIPLVCLIILPIIWLAILTDMVQSNLADEIFSLAILLGEGLLVGLEWARQLPSSYLVHHADNLGQLICAMLGLLLFMIVPITPIRISALVLLLPLLNPTEVERPKPGNMHLSMLDVGQGLAIVVRTQNHVLLYDTGPDYGQFASAGDRIVVPWLVRRGIRKIDTLVVSHFDRDHSGGLRGIVANITSPKILSSNLVRARALVGTGSNKHTSIQHQLCLAGQAWQWDGVEFKILWPRIENLLRASSNNQSCILHIKSKNYSVLLLGDIDTTIEKRLAQASDLSTDLLVVAHHGSRHSTHPKLLEASQAKLALISAGALNRWQMPNIDVLQRLNQAGIPWLSTAQQGTISAHWQNNRIRILTQIKSESPHWYTPTQREYVPCDSLISYHPCMK